MDLYLIRHADAVPMGGEITADENRPLSDKGKDQSRLVGRVLESKGITLNVLVASPLLRARETAQLLLENLSQGPEATTCDELAPDGKPRKVARFLRGLKGAHIALVGHMPQLGEMAGWLVGSRKASIDFAKAGIACITCGEEVEKGCGTLVWLVTPQWT